MGAAVDVATGAAAGLVLTRFLLGVNLAFLLPLAGIVAQLCSGTLLIVVCHRSGDELRRQERQYAVNLDDSCCCYCLGRAD